MEWNFLFRIDYLKTKGEERNLKGVIFTDDEQPPTSAQILRFLKECGYQVEVKDSAKLLFVDPNPDNPVHISIVQLGNHDKPNNEDSIIKTISEQFRKDYPM